jgi:hypothetical protein
MTIMINEAGAATPLLFETTKVCDVSLGAFPTALWMSLVKSPKTSHSVHTGTKQLQETFLSVSINQTRNLCALRDHQQVVVSRTRLTIHYCVCSLVLIY